MQRIRHTIPTLYMTVLRKTICVAMIVVFIVTIALISPAWAACAAVCNAISETTKLTFPTLEKPAAGSVTYTIPADGGAASGSATVLYGSGTRGSYLYVSRFSTAECASTSYSVANVSSGNAGVTYSGWEIYTAASHNMPYTENGVYPATAPGTARYIGATITITSSATTGAFSPSYDLVCSIQ